MPSKPWLWLIALTSVGCIEYGVEKHQENNHNDDSDTDTDLDTADSAPPIDEDCQDQVFEGYATSSDAECEHEVETGTFDPIVEWNWEDSTTGAGSNWIMSTPVVGQLNDDDGDSDIDNDDTPDIVVVTFYSTYLRAFSGDGSGEHWSTAAPGIEYTGGAALADLDGDGITEIIACNGTGVTVFDNNGTQLWVSEAAAYGVMHGTSDVPAVSDMDHDGSPEIIAGRGIWDADGDLVGLGAYGKGGNPGNVGTCSFAADVDADGDEEVVVGNALYQKDGTALWNNGLSDGYPAVADFDGDGDAEIAVSGNGQIRLQDTDGTELWTESIPGAGTAYYGGPPTIADYDGDGEPEIGLASGSRYSVFDADGTLMWQMVTDDSSSGNTGSAVFDFEGDGAAEAVYADQTRLWVFSGIDGSVKLESTEHGNGTWLEYPVIVDVDGDDHVEIVVPNTPQTSPPFTGFHVFGDADDSWRPGRKIWNQHAYHITNINDDASIPATADLNWLTYNNFRSGDMTAGSGFSSPDLVVAQADLCEIDCDENVIYVWAQVGNEGAEDAVPSTTVEFIAVIDGDETILETVDITDPVPVGWYMESLQFEQHTYDPRDLDQVIVRVHGADADCHPENDQVVFDGPFCQEAD